MILIKNGKLVAMTDNTKEGDILLKDGKIEKIGQNLDQPEGAKVIDATGKTIMPGMVDPHTHLGIYEEGVMFEGDDVNELTDPITPELRGIDGLNPYDDGLREARINGITSAVTGPGSGNVIGGQALAIKTHGKSVDQMVIKEPTGLKCAFGENPKRVYSEKNKMPMTRMATAALLRKKLVEAENYLNKLEKAEEDPDKSPDKDMQKEVLIKALQGELPLRAHAHRSDDILTALRIAKEFNLQISIEHGTESHKVTKEIKENNVPVVVGPSMTSRSKVELNERTFHTPKALFNAGIKFAIMTDHPVIPIYTLPICAGMAVKEGLPEEEALRAITLYAAEIAGIDDRVGSLDEGKDADVLVFSGNPLSIESNLEHVFISGEEIV